MKSLIFTKIAKSTYPNTHIVFNKLLKTNFLLFCIKQNFPPPKAQAGSAPADQRTYRIHSLLLPIHKFIAFALPLIGNNKRNALL